MVQVADRSLERASVEAPRYRGGSGCNCRCRQAVAHSGPPGWAQRVACTTASELISPIGRRAVLSMMLMGKRLDRSVEPRRGRYRLLALESDLGGATNGCSLRDAQYDSGRPIPDCSL